MSFILYRCQLPYLALLASFLLFSSSGWAQQKNDKTESPYFFVEGGDSVVDRLPLKHTAVSVQIAAVIADVTVRQTYRNEGTKPISARYVFPASTKAAVHGMTMRIGERVVRAVVKRRKEARHIYEKAKEAGKSASLLEQQRPNVFSMNVANIMPGDQVDVELNYTELLVPTDGVYELVYPTVVGPRYRGAADQGDPAEPWVASPYTHSGEAPKYTFAFEGVVSTGVPLHGLSCPTHKVDVHWQGPTRASIATKTSERYGGNRDLVLRYRLTGKQIASGLLLHKGQKENFFLLTVQPPERVVAEEIPAREYVFILDVSGSMHGYPLDTAKALLRQLATNMRPIDRFNVLLFSGWSALIAPKSMPATPQNIVRALKLIDQEQGGGGTELLSALKRAMALPTEGTLSRSFVVVTDGYISAERSVFDYVRAHLGQANLFTFGIGTGINHYLIEGLSRAGMGEPFVVRSAKDAPKVSRQLREYIESPVLTNIKVAYDGFDVYDVEPPSIPDVFAQRPVVVFGKWRGQATGKIRLSGMSGKGRYQQTFEVAKGKSGAETHVLRYLWARTRIANLSDFGDDTPSDERKEQVTQLGLSYNLLTKYTSFVAVHDVVRNKQGAAKNVSQPLPLPKGVSDNAVGVEGGSEPEFYLLIGLALALFSVAFVMRRRQGCNNVA